jgi:polysaccharide biosynthesis protein VpsM
VPDLIKARYTELRPSAVRNAGFCALVLTMAWSAQSAAQDGPQFGIAPSSSTQRAISDPPTESRRTDEGLYAAVGVAYSHRSNVRRESVEGAGDESDSAYVITPQAGYKRYFGRHSAEVGVRTQFTRFKDFSDENTQNYTIDGLTNLDITRTVDLDLFASFTDAAEPRGGSGTRFIQDLEPDEVEVTRFGGAATVGQQTGRMQVQVGADRSQWRYQNNQQEFRDRDNDRVHGRVFYNISPRTAVFVGASHTNIDFIRQGLDADSEERTYEVGARWDVSARTTGQVSVGRTRKDFDNPAVDDAETTTLAGRLSWSPRQRTTFNLYGSRQFEETTSVDDNFYISELLGVSVSQSFGARWNAFAYYNLTDDEFDSGRNDDITDYGVGLDYSLRRWLSVGAQYSVIERESNIPGFDYEDEVVSLFLNGNFEVGRR